MFRYLLALAGNPADAEDALQETFLAAWRAAGTFRGTGPARAWLLTIARHASHRLGRRRAHEPAELLPLDQLGPAAGWGEPEGTGSDGVIAISLVRSALERLTPEEREVIVLRDLEGFTGQEAAALIGLTLPALKTRLHRARLRLAAELRRPHD